MSNGSEHTPERTWLQPGDRVRLTGLSWTASGLFGQTATVVEIDLDGDALIEDPTGGVLAIYTNPEAGIDYSAERVEGEHDPWEGFTGESPEEAAYAEGWKDAREHDTFGALRDRIVALEAVLAGVGALADRAEHGALRWAVPLPVPEWVPRVRALLALAPSTVLDQMIREAKAEALREVADEWVAGDCNLYAADVLRAKAITYRNGGA